MSLLIGIERCKIDANGRFKLPIAIKKQIGGEDNRFVVRKSVYADCLELWTYTSFEEETKILNQKLNMYKKEDMMLLRKLLMCNSAELDANDRLLIPPEQKDRLKSAKEIVLQSVGKFIEIWDYETYKKMEEDDEDFANMVDQRLGGAADSE